ncbi:hypothetical protein RUND412_001128 [Rhizina undulata]
MSGAPPPPNYAGSPPSPPQGVYYPPPPEKSQQQYPPPPGHEQSSQSTPSLGQQQQQQYPPPPTSQQQYFPPPPPPPVQPQQPPQQSPQQQQYPPPPANPHRVSLPPQQLAYDPARNGPPPMPLQIPQPSASNSVIDTIGTFNGGSYRIDHRDTNTVLTLELAHGCPIVARPGAMIAMSPSVTLKGEIKFSLKKVIAGGQLTQANYTGPGEVLLAPPALGDIVPIRLDGQQAWNIGRDSFLASTQGVEKDLKNQGLGKAMFSGEGLFVYKVTGQGVFFVTSLGAILQKNLGPGDSFIVDNHHLIAWNCKYNIERVASGGIISSVSAHEGLVCRFTGPGTIFFQTRSPKAFHTWLVNHGANNHGS